VILCASELRSDLRAAGPPHAEPLETLGTGTPDVDRLVALAAEAEFDGIALGAHAILGDLAPLVTVAAAARLQVPVVAAPLGEGRLRPGRRLPYLATLDDDDERRAAVALFRRVVEAAVPLGVRLYTVTLGAVPSPITAAAIGRRFARRDLEEDEPGVAEWERALAARRGLSGRVHDACRYALDRMMPLAERHGVTVAVELAAGPWGMPTPREAGDLLAAYREAPLRIVWDDARMQVLRALGIAPSPDRLEVLAGATAVWRAHEAVGMEAGYLPGLGDPDDEAGTFRRKMGPVATVVSGRADSTRNEVARARDRFRETPEKAAHPSP
jgi:sugar phosphate isomerase/epimerase